MNHFTVKGILFKLEWHITIINQEVGKKTDKNERIKRNGVKDE